MSADQDLLLTRAVARLMPAGQVVELRAPKARLGRGDFRATLSGYFDDPVKLLTEAEKVVAPGVYFTLNPVKVALLARCADKVQQADKGDAATTDKDILRRR